MVGRLLCGRFARPSEIPLSGNDGGCLASVRAGGVLHKAEMVYGNQVPVVVREEVGRRNPAMFVSSFCGDSGVCVYRCGVWCH